MKSIEYHLYDHWYDSNHSFLIIFDASPLNYRCAE